MLKVFWGGVHLEGLGGKEMGIYEKMTQVLVCIQGRRIGNGLKFDQSHRCRYLGWDLQQGMQLFNP